MPRLSLARLRQLKSGLMTDLLERVPEGAWPVHDKKVKGLSRLGRSEGEHTRPRVFRSAPSRSGGSAGPDHFPADGTPPEAGPVSGEGAGNRTRGRVRSPTRFAVMQRAELAKRLLGSGRNWSPGRDAVCELNEERVREDEMEGSK